MASLSLDWAMDQPLGEVSTAARDLRTDDAESANLLRGYLERLATLLAGHLDYEEASLFPYFKRMTRDWHRG